MNIFFIICGYASILFALITQTPQIVTMVKNKSSKNISYAYLLLIGIDCILYMLYGTGFLLDNNYDGIPTVIVGVIPFIINFIVFCIKIHFDIKKWNIKNKKKLEKSESVDQEVNGGIPEII